MNIRLTNKYNNALDFRFAWRWLLPLCEDSKLVAFGLNCDEVEWWQQHYDLNSKQKVPTGLLISLDELSSVQLNKCLEQYEVDWLCAWGKGKGVSRLASKLSAYSCVRTYALLPASLPRVVVPCSSVEVATAGLRLHQPGRNILKFGLLMANMLVQLRSYRLIQKRTLLIAYKKKVGHPLIAQKPDCENITVSCDYALYLGAPTPGRKTIALPLPLSTRDCIIKTGDNPEARESLRNEAATLDMLQHTLLKKHVPALHSFEDSRTKVTLIQEYRNRHKTTDKKQKLAVLEFLERLATVGIEQSTLKVYLERISDSLPPELDALKNHISSLNPGTRLLLHRCHGDFAPWNCAWTEQGLFVYDWEASYPEGLLFSDAFYYATAPLLHITRVVYGRRALQSALAIATPLSQRIDMKGADCRLYLALWLLGQSEPVKLHRQMSMELIKSW